MSKFYDEVIRKLGYLKIRLGFDRKYGILEDDFDVTAKSITDIHNKEIAELQDRIMKLKNELWWITDGWREEANRDLSNIERSNNGKDN